MNILLCTTIVFSVVAVAVTIYAVATAKDGIEDELGFHLVRETAAPDSDVVEWRRARRSRNFGRQAPLPVPHQVAPLSKTLWVSHT